MDITILKNLVSDQLSIRQIAHSLKCSPTNVRYWLKKFNLNTSAKRDVVTEKFCPKCQVKKSIEEFYKTNNAIRSRYGGYCKLCSNLYHSNRVKDIKIKMIKEKGGKCQMCSLLLENTHYSVFEFHHRNPKEKDVNFSKIKYQKWSIILSEINKCDLLCANCHRITHAKIEKW